MGLEQFFDSRRKAITLDGGVEAVVRMVDTREAFLAAGAMVGVEPITAEKSMVVGRELIRRALVSLGGEADPFGRELITIDDLTFEDREKILEVVYDKLSTRGKPEDTDGVPLAPTGSLEG
jgi:hypothetical protein